MRLHSDDKKLFHFVEGELFSLARYFGLDLTQVKPMPRRHTGTRRGDCSADGIIRITLRDGDDREAPHSIADTMAHELAHLKHWKHRDDWLGLYGNILLRMSARKTIDRLRVVCELEP